MNKEDRELLELAALAANKEYGWQHIFDDYEGSTSEKWDWNPLEDDGDAFRLAVKLQFRIDIMPWGAEAAKWNDYNSTGSEAEQHKDDPYKATRRAIVRAAAEIGRLMQVRKIFHDFY
jgi:hypothetical protein